MVLGGEDFNSLCQAYSVPWKSLLPLQKSGGHVQEAKHSLRGFNDQPVWVRKFSFGHPRVG